MARIEQQIAQPEFWNDPQATQPVMQKRKALAASLKQMEQFIEQEEDISVLADLDGEGEDVDADLESG